MCCSGVKWDLFMEDLLAHARFATCIPMQTKLSLKLCHLQVLVKQGLFALILQDVSLGNAYRSVIYGMNSLSSPTLSSLSGWYQEVKINS